MTTQLFWIILAVFILGLFIGSNLGVMLMCLLRLSAQEHGHPQSLVTLPVEAEH
jgi:hypothetical protein